MVKDLNIFTAMMDKPSQKKGKYSENEVKKVKIRKKISFLIDYNKKYGPTSMGGDTYWIGALNDGRNRGGKPYYCPIGWKRWTLQVRNLDGNQFANMN